MAENNDDFLLDYELNSDEIPITIELALAMKADEVEKFLELYDSIPTSVETKRIDNIKEMARQLAALPKKQFDMYRSKSRMVMAGEHFTPPLLSTLTAKEKFSSDQINNASHISDRSNNDSACTKKIENKDDTANPEVGEAVATKSTKKKSKKKKKNKKAYSDAEVSSNGDTAKCFDNGTTHGLEVENKFLDPDITSSRIVTMNKSMVADICVMPLSASQSTVPNSKKTSNEIVTSNTDITKASQKKQSPDDQSSDDVDNDSQDQQSSPPFGFPLMTDKLIQSALGLLSCESFNNDIAIPTREINQEDRKQVFIEPHKIDSNKDAKHTTAVCNEDYCMKIAGMNSGPTSSRKDNQNFTKHIQMDTECDKAVDGDISNLSAQEDQGWQSQVKRSHRKKKKELAFRNSREKSQSNQKNKKEFPKEYKSNNFKKQNNQNGGECRNQKQTTKETHKTNNLYSATKDNIVGEHHRETNGLVVKECRDKPDVEAKPAAFSYRDALLKTKSKATEEVQDNSDSGVEVNSVSSCDSAINSPKLPEFDLKEAVNFLIKGCNEVTELHMQEKVQYYSDICGEPINKKKIQGKSNSRKIQSHQPKV